MYANHTQQNSQHGNGSPKGNGQGKGTGRPKLVVCLEKNPVRTGSHPRNRGERQIVAAEHENKRQRRQAYERGGSRNLLHEIEFDDSEVL